MANGIIGIQDSEQIIKYSFSVFLYAIDNNSNIASKIYPHLVFLGFSNIFSL